VKRGWRRACRRAAERDVRAVVLYDPDPINPYGRELAALLASRIGVTLVCTRGHEWVPTACKSRAWLTRGREHEGTIVALLSRVAGPVAAIALAAATRRPLVAVWTRDAWDALCLAGASATGLPVIYLDHNPTLGRRRSGLAGRAQTVLEAKARLTVVHGDELAQEGLRSRAKVLVIDHLPYVKWRERYFRGRDGVLRGTAHELLLLGALRSDKGLSQVPAIMEHIRVRPITCHVVGRGSLPTGWLDDMHARGVEVRRPETDGFVTDEAMAQALATASLLLAPYTSATQSGAVVLARTCGVPVAGYANGSLQRMVQRDHLAVTGAVEELAHLVEDLLVVPSSRTDSSPGSETDAWADRCLEGWLACLASAIGRYGTRNLLQKEGGTD
jgi:hypothetical protein